jgi:Kef-type K+ transport system membrane component KefB
MNTRGLMELIALNIGLDIGVISQTVFTIMVLMALVTTFMTSPLLEWVYPSRLTAVDQAEPDSAARHVA